MVTGYQLWWHGEEIAHGLVAEDVGYLMRGSNHLRNIRF
jgi:hypothetical protein